MSYITVYIVCLYCSYYWISSDVQGLGQILSPQIRAHQLSIDRGWVLACWSGSHEPTFEVSPFIASRTTPPGQWFRNEVLWPQAMWAKQSIALGCHSVVHSLTDYGRGKACCSTPYVFRHVHAARSGAQVLAMVLSITSELLEHLV